MLFTKIATGDTTATFDRVSPRFLEFDPHTGTASECMDVSVFGSTAINIDALFLIESGPDAGKLILSTTGNATLGGLAFRSGDLIKCDKVADTAQLFFDQDAISGAASQKNVDALHVLRGGGLILSVNISNGTLGGVVLKSSDLVRHDPVGGATSVYLNGADLFDGVTANLDSATGHPSTVPTLAPSHWAY